VVALLDSTGGRRETVAYSAYGVPFGRPAADANGDGTVNVSDFFVISAAFGESLGDPNYSIRADINLDGTVDSSDSTIHSGQSGYALGRGNLSRNPSLAGGVGSRLGYAGYAWEPSASKYHERHRVLDPVRGRWSKRDPLGYVDAPTMYAYVSNRAMSAVDPTGLFSILPIENPGLPDRTHTPKYACAPYSVLGADESVSNNPGCPMGGASGAPPPVYPPQGRCVGLCYAEWRQYLTVDPASVQSGLANCSLPKTCSPTCKTRIALAAYNAAKTQDMPPSEQANHDCQNQQCQCGEQRCSPPGGPIQSHPVSVVAPPVAGCNCGTCIVNINYLFQIYGCDGKCVN
jgi:RHS repeat-associated protein